ncbi:MULTISPECIES: phage holin family protein, partial [unclassified Enterococcus]|uniref:phage holin family protein n=1 Tax=unclassified Enterococcus TaxID=2608891 RepID=UPI001556E05B
AIINPSIEFKSKIGINGILRKISSIVLLLFFIPLSILIPNNLGTALLYTLYIGYLLMEIKSIFENYQKLGTPTEVFQKFIDVIKNNDDTSK